MIYYECLVNLAGDRNHVVRKRYQSPAELMCLQAIHGAGSVYRITREPSKGRDSTPYQVIKDRLQKQYGRTRIGPDNDPRPLLPQVFPGWPNASLPGDASGAGIDPLMFAEDERPKPAAPRKSRAKASEPEPEPETDTSFAE